MLRGAAFGCLVAVSACSLETSRGEVGVYQIPATGVAGAAGSGTADPGPEKPALFLTLVLRDFKHYDAADPTTNPAFDNDNSEKSVVAAELGSDRKPVYRAPSNAVPTFGKDYFDQWYRDVPGTNIPVVYPLPWARTADGFYEYDSQQSGQPDVYLGVSRRVFFPLDDGGAYATLFGNQGQSHNHAFTAELHATFTARDGASISLRSDDDLYLFIDGKLVVDLGGTHSALTAEQDVDELALTPGQSYAFDLFYAERMGATGALTVRTNLELAPVVLP